MDHSLLRSSAENSHIIQVYTANHSIWRGNEWSTIILDVKVDRFLTDNQESHILCAFIEHISTKHLHLPWKSDHLKVEFEKHILEGHPYCARILQTDTKNKLILNIHKTLFEHGDKFRVLVAAQKLEDRRNWIVFGASEQIS
jgi:hypothetical protein